MVKAAPPTCCHQSLLLIVNSNLVNEILIIKQPDALIFQIYFWNKILHVSDSSSVHHQEFFTVHAAMVYVIQVLLTACKQDQDGTAVPS